MLARVPRASEKNVELIAPVFLSYRVNSGKCYIHIYTRTYGKARRYIPVSPTGGGDNNHLPIVVWEGGRSFSPSTNSCF